MGNTLIVYYSLFHNTENLALEIAAQTGGTLKELIPEKNYSFDYNTAAKEVRNQISRGYSPKLISGCEPINDYGTIFIGSPNWFKTIAPPVLSFLKQHDFTGKTIIPFCTHGGGGFGQIENDISKECSNSIIMHGIAVNGTAAPEDIIKWLETIGLHKDICSKIDKQPGEIVHAALREKEKR